MSTSNGIAANLAKSRSREFGSSNCRIFKKFDSPLGTGPAETPVKLQRNRKTVDIDLAASRLRKILR